VTKPWMQDDKAPREMKDRTGEAEVKIYPARYFEASPTWMQWNRLTAADVHALETRPGFEGQDVYFHLNHPMQFFRIAGMIVDINLVGNGRYTMIALDDGSGKCIDAKITMRDPNKDDVAVYPSNTTVDNVNVHVEMSVPSLEVDSKAVDIGSIVKIRGTLSVFRNTRQLELKRMSVINDTNAEVKAWAETAAWKRDVLSKPWKLTTAQRYGVDEKIRKAEKAEREMMKKLNERRAKFLEKKRRHDEKYEAKRLKEEKRLNEGALKGSHVIAAPWD
jgi:hypothetical protein